MRRYPETLTLRVRYVERRKAMAELRNRLETALNGRYTIGREIGRGGMAIVYLARDLRHGRDVALKVLRPELAATLGPDRFLQEIRLAAGLAHPHILPLHDSGEADGCLFYVMPFVPGESLRDRLERDGQLPLVDALAIAREIADALGYAHQAGVVHRDIKPENILLQAGHAVVSDFGIARAISAAGSRRVTAVGTTVGTPDYMSPEQAAATGPIDGRSDIYSLGCVLFEMLAGTPPAALTPPEGPAAGPLRPRDRLAELVALRPSVPPAVAGVVARMLAPAPGDRFASGADAADALAAPSGVWTPRSVAARRRRRWGAGLVTLGVLTAATVVVLRRVSAAELDPTLYVIVPFEHRGEAAPALLSGDQCELLLREAFERWAGVRLVDGFRARDADLQRGAQSQNLGGALATAKALHSGLMVWGEVDALGDSILVRAGLYDVATGASLRQHEIRLDQGLHRLGALFDQLADSLLLDVHSPAAAGGAMGTRDIRAWRAYQAAHDALTRWDLEAAERQLREAVGLDPPYPQANYWLAQIQEWRDGSALEWRERAVAALASGTALGPVDRIRAEALVAMADGRYPQACDHYRALVERDSLDFSAWYGLGECHAKDAGVVADPTSASGWGFRGSYRAAVDAFTKAFRINLSIHRAFQGDQLSRLQRTLYTETNVFRRGRGLAPDTGQFAAFPSLDHDTLAFVPYRLQDWIVGAPGTLPETQRTAVARNRETLRAITTVWVRAFPADVDALAAQASVLETMGQLSSAGSDERSAIAMIRRARQVAGNGEQALRLALVEARLSLKLQDFSRARLLADSLLRAFGDSAPPAVAGPLARLAELTGHVYRAARLLPRSEPEDSLVSSDGVELYAPPAVLEGSLALLAYAAAGGPVDSIRVLEGRIDRAVESLVEPAGRTRVRQAALDWPATLAFPVLGVSPVHRARAGGLALMELQYALAGGDTAKVRSGLGAAVKPTRQGLPGDLPIDFAYQEAWLLLAIGDTAGASARVGAPLDALPTLGTDLLDLVAQSAGLVRAMSLRADLAARAGDARTAARWAGAVVTLWSDADPPLQPVVARMRSLAGSN